MKYVLVVALVFGVVSCDDSGSGPSGVCGNGLVDGSEQCDGSNLDGYTCQNWGYYSGTLTCREDCTFDKTSCEAAGYCGDGTQDWEEECDGTVNGETCEGLDYGSGVLRCGDDCLYDLSGCSNFSTCGNDYRELYEECDGDNLNGKTCEDFGYHGDGLRCSPGCRLDKSLCRGSGACGDGNLDVGYEECDHADLGGATCQSLGYYGGQLYCNSADCTFNTALCEGCGDGVLQGFESCDGTNLQGATCESLGYYGGQLRCSDQCDLDPSDCLQYGRCGDGTIQAPESCDGTDLGSATCEDFGFYHGQPGCTLLCQIVPTGCTGFCGDGVLETDQGETCDVGNVPTCRELGYAFGQAFCDYSSCGLNTDGCHSTERFGFSQYDAVADAIVDSHGRIVAVGIINGQAAILVWDPNTGLVTELSQIIDLPAGSAVVTIRERNGKYYLAGSRPVSTASGPTDLWVATVDATSPISITSAQITSFGCDAEDKFPKIFVQDTGNYYLAWSMKGTYNGFSSVGGTDGILGFFDSGNSFERGMSFGTETDDNIVDMYVAETGDIYILGNTEGDFDGIIGQKDCYVIKVSANLQTSTRLQFGTDAVDLCRGITGDEDGIYVIGSTGGSLPGETSAGSTDMVVFAYTFSLQPRWARQIGTPGEELGTAILSVPGEGLFIGGRTTGALWGLDSHVGPVVGLLDPGTGVTLWGVQGTAEAGIDCPVLLAAPGRYVYFLLNATGAVNGQPNLGSIDTYLWGVSMDGP